MPNIDLAAIRERAKEGFYDVFAEGNVDVTILLALVDELVGALKEHRAIYAGIRVPSEEKVKLTPEDLRDKVLTVLEEKHVINQDVMSLLPELWEIFRAALAEQREADIVAVCWFCLRHRPFTDDSQNYHAGTDIDGDPIQIHCVAGPIRRKEGRDGRLPTLR